MQTLEFKFFRAYPTTMKPGSLGKIAVFSAFVAMLPLAVVGSGTTVQIDAFNRGHYKSNGRHDAIQNTYTGYDGLITHSYFAFDLAPIEGMTVTAATLVLELWAFFGPAGSFHQYDLYAVDSDVADVVATRPANSPEGQVIWADLGSGTFFGSDTVNQFPPLFSAARPGRAAQRRRGLLAQRRGRKQLCHWRQSAHCHAVERIGPRLQ